ncbi:MAG: tetratricopeptide repeat protein [Proteobacteria bacterium]|nr:tetratricopeptide repeat protein [Pseudomonadota bacterium]
MAARLQSVGEIQRAEDIYRSVLAEQPEQPDALHLLGVVMFQRGNHAAAIDFIGQAVARQPGIAMYHNNLGKVYRAMDRFEDALVHFNRALELDSNMIEALYNSGEVLRWLRKSGDALEMLDRAIALHPGYSVALLCKGEIMQKEGRVDEALNCYRQAIASAPDKAGIYFGVGQALTALGRRDEAIKHYQTAVALRPSWAAPHLELADMYKKDGKLNEAADCCHRVLSFQPDNVFARHMLYALEGAPIERASAEYVRQLFDGYASSFDQNLLEKLDYRTPAMLAELMRNYLAGKDGEWHILDIGCGTGLMGPELRGLGKRLVGVDLSAKMLQKAQERGVYNELLEGDLVERMVQFPSASFDVGVAADVFVYVGNLAPVFEQCRRILREQGVLAFSIERLSDDTCDFTLELTQRFKHSCGYIDRLCSRFGFIVVHREFAHIRKQGRDPVEGCLYLLRKA